MNRSTTNKSTHVCTSSCGHGPHPHTPKKLTELTAQLRSKARKITGPRQGILDSMRQNRHPATIKEIFGMLPKGDCDLATVYRSMHLLEEMNMVKRFDFGDGVARFELVDDANGGHHHHLVCTECSKIVELDDCFAEELERSVEKRHGFRSVTHKLEFFGICPSCQ